MAKKLTRVHLKQELNAYSNRSSAQFKRRFCGRKIGEGSYRQVYEFLIDDRFIVKIQRLPAFENNLESFIWDEICSSPNIYRYFAEVIWKNNNGTVIVMEKIKVLSNSDRKLPARVPAFFSDLHPGNYGFKGRQIVCCDYGNSAITLGWNKLKTKKCEWE